MAVSKKPVSLILRAYQVGFGDCFLLTFRYADKNERHVLIDFGSTGLPKELPKDQMLRVAEEIRRQCEGNLDIIVATHRHKDHISGFSREGQRNDKGETTGDIIKSCNPKMIIQPWTENPELDDSQLELQLKGEPVSESAFRAEPEKHFYATLRDMQAFAKTVKTESEKLNLKPQKDNPEAAFSLNVEEKIKKQLFFMGDNNLPNESAVKNLREMGKDGKAQYVNFGNKLGLSEILPGMKVHFLGPPSLDQHREILKQRSSDKDEFWMLHSLNKNFWGMQAATAQVTVDANDSATEDQNRLFPNYKVFQDFTPSHTRWFIGQLQSIRAEQLLGLVRILDKAMNNTSVILLFEINDKKLLFPGDAQIENWEYALKQPEAIKLLKDTDLYKVGHHGSRNATPKSLWNKFAKKSKEKNKQDRLSTVISTMAGKHGHTPETAVPRATLVNVLAENSNYVTTETLTDDNICQEIKITL